MKYTRLFVITLSLSLSACGKSRVSTASPTPTPVINEPGAGGQNLSPADRAARRQQRITQMETSLGLSDEQTQKVTALFESQRPAMEALRNDQTMTQDQKREKMQAIRQTMESQLATILTPEQKVKWEAQRSQWQQRGNRPGVGAQ